MSCPKHKCGHHCNRCFIRLTGWYWYVAIPFGDATAVGITFAEAPKDSKLSPNVENSLFERRVVVTSRLRTPELGRSRGAVM
jgi:hypothetical protein